MRTKRAVSFPRSKRFLRVYAETYDDERTRFVTRRFKRNME